MHPEDPLADALAAWEAGTVTRLEALDALRRLAEIPTVAGLVARLPAELAADVAAPAGHVGPWTVLGSGPDAEGARQLRVAARVLSEWAAGRWRAWSHAERPLRADAPERDETRMDGPVRYNR